MLISNLQTDINIFYKTNASNYGLLNPLFIRKNNCLTWSNRDSSPRYSEYEKQFDWAINNNQYSILFGDKGFFQLYYECNENRLINSSISYWPNPTESFEYFRLDFDSKADHSLNHPEFHMHFGYPSNFFRISLSHFPFPSEFFNLVLQLYGKSITSFKASNFIKKSATSIIYNTEFSFKVH